jgi:hypothetical protein
MSGPADLCPLVDLDVCESGGGLVGGVESFVSDRGEPAQSAVAVPAVVEDFKLF